MRAIVAILTALVLALASAEPHSASEPPIETQLAGELAPAGGGHPLEPTHLEASPRRVPCAACLLEISTLGLSQASGPLLGAPADAGPGPLADPLTGFAGCPRSGASRAPPPPTWV